MDEFGRPDFVAPAQYPQPGGHVLPGPVFAGPGLDEKELGAIRPVAGSSATPAPRRHRRVGVIALVLVVLAGLLGGAALLAPGKPAQARIPDYHRAQPTAPTSVPTTREVGLTAQLTRGVVIVTGDTGVGMSAGTGIVESSDGIVLTNYHVVADTLSLRVRVADTNESYNARVLGTDKTHDIAILQLGGAQGLDVAKFQANPPAVGEAVTVVGNARGGGVLLASSGAVTTLDYTARTKSNFGGYGVTTMTGMIGSSAGAVPGYSGGPTFNAAGEVIGITTLGADVVNNDHTYSIPIKRALTTLEAVLAGQQTDLIRVGPGPYLGIGLNALNVPTIMSVVPGSPADEAGLRPADTITAVDGTQITTAGELLQILNTYDPGQTVRLTINAQRQVVVQLGQSDKN